MKESLENIWYISGLKWLVNSTLQEIQTRLDLIKSNAKMNLKYTLDSNIDDMHNFPYIPDKQAFYGSKKIVFKAFYSENGEGFFKSYSELDSSETLDKDFWAFIERQYSQYELPKLVLWESRMDYINNFIESISLQIIENYIESSKELFCNFDWTSIEEIESSKRREVIYRMKEYLKDGLLDKDHYDEYLEQWNYLRA